jgi:hypothetical protein
MSAGLPRLTIAQKMQSGRPARHSHSCLHPIAGLPARSPPTPILTLSNMPSLIRRPGARNQSGEEAVGQALLVAGVAAGALGASALARIAVSGMHSLIAALG